MSISLNNLDEREFKMLFDSLPKSDRASIRSTEVDFQKIMTVCFQKRLEVFENETGLLPYVIADQVVTDLELWLQKNKMNHFNLHWYFENKKNSYIDRLVNRILLLYENDKYKKRLNTNSNRGRDLTYTFFQHWLSSIMKQEYRLELPIEYSIKGLPLPH